MPHVSELLVPGFSRLALLCRGRMPRARGMAAPNLSVVVAKFWSSVCGVRQNFYVFSLSRNPTYVDGRIFNSLLTSMFAVQAQDMGDSFLFVDDLNGNHQE